MTENVFWNILDGTYNVKPAKILGQAKLVARQQAFVVAKVADSKGVKNLGFEGFYISGIQRIPLMECIADFSSDQPTLRQVYGILESEGFKKAVLMADNNKDLKLYSANAMNYLGMDILRLGLVHKGDPITEDDARAIVMALADFEEMSSRFINKYLPRILEHIKDKDKDKAEDVMYDFSSSFAHSINHINASAYLGNIMNNFRINEELAAKELGDQEKTSK